MSEPALATPMVPALAACCLSIMVLALDLPSASAQCSQASRPTTPPPAQSAFAAPDSLSSAKADESSSTRETTYPVRFETGTTVTVLENTPLQVFTDVPVSSRTTRAGAKLPFTVTRDVIVGGVLVIPCGTRVFGTVVSSKQAGRLAGASNLTLELTELNLDGKSYPLYTTPFKVVGQSKTRPTVTKVATGAGVGALAADATVPTVTHTVLPGNTVSEKIPAGDRAKGDALVAGVGAGVGVAIAASSPPSIALIPAESEIEFNLASPIAVYPVDQRTAARLSRGMRHDGPVLYIRGETQ